MLYISIYAGIEEDGRSFADVLAENDEARIPASNAKRAAHGRAAEGDAIQTAAAEVSVRLPCIST